MKNLRKSHMNPSAIVPGKCYCADMILSSRCDGVCLSLSAGEGRRLKGESEGETREGCWRQSIAQKGDLNSVQENY